MSLNHPLRGVADHRSEPRGRARRAAAAGAALVLAALVAAPSALAWNGNLEVRKVNIGGPAADSFGFKVESGAYGQPTFTLVPATDYTGASWAGKAKPDNPFTLVGAPSAAGPFERSGTTPNDALFTGLDSGGQSAAAAPAVRDWRRFRVTETTKPANYTTSAACTIANASSGAGWTGLDQAWGAWTATPTTAGGGDGVETTVRFLPDTVATADRGPWTVVCTFTNTYHAPTTPPASGTSPGGPTTGTTPSTPATPATPSPPTKPAGNTSRVGTARAVGTTGCVTGASAIVDVRGRGIVRVTFKLNGKTVKTLTNDNVAGMYRLRVASSRLPVGTSRVTADVRFRKASRVAAKRLAFQLNRCPTRRAARTPSFTG